MLRFSNQTYSLESSGYDITPVLTSLVQLLADPSSRTILGFQSLLQREWVAGGFPFLNRLGHLFQPTKAKSNNRLIPDANGSAVVRSCVVISSPYKIQVYGFRA